MKGVVERGARARTRLSHLRAREVYSFLSLYFSRA